MGKHKTIIPTSSAHTLLKANRTLRISKRSAEITAQFLEESSQEVIVQAQKNAQHRASRTINEDDVQLAIKQTHYL